jgi:DNA-binding PadR family transcriptional regulator
MEVLVTTRGALLQALRQGPGYGLELIRRVANLTDGRVRLTEARVYPVLKALTRGGLVRTSRVVPRGRRGARSRTYYDLTPRGVEVSHRDRLAFFGLAGLRPRGARPEPDRLLMARRLDEAEELTAFAEDLRRAMPGRVLR